LAHAYEQRAEWRAAASVYETILRHKDLCIGADGASTIYVKALQSMMTALEKAGRSAESAKYREEYQRLGVTAQGRTHLNPANN
jgi:hypothetical protein